MDYKENRQDISTGIHTRVDKNIRISSIYRRYANANFEVFGWETILWIGDQIEYTYSPLDSAEEVINQHITILNEFV